MGETQDRLEIQRVDNLTKGFGWTMVKQELTDDEMIIELRKPRAPIEGVPPVGPG